MTVRDIARILETWAPTPLAWEKDNVGLQVGSPGSAVRTVLVALDLTDAVVAEARRRRADLVVTHHPMLYAPLRRVDPGERTGRMLAALLRSGIAVYAAHTNLDFTDGGVSHLLAARLGLGAVRVLAPAEGTRRKIVTFVPRGHADAVRDAMARAGAGVIGAYTACSFATGGTGTFLGGPGASPAVGKAGTLERADELRLEMAADAWSVDGVVAALKAAHPYEEVAYDVYRLENADGPHGAGAVGTLAKAESLRTFLARVRRSVGTPALRYAGDPRARIRTVAVCGGSGSELLGAAIRAGADAFVTADVRYHTFQEPDGRIALIDAGHFETEVPAVAAIAARLARDGGVRARRVKIIVSRSSKNPVHYFPS